MYFIEFFDALGDDEFEDFTSYLNDDKYIIAVEGLDATGKSTLVPNLASRLDAEIFRSSGLVQTTHEPFTKSAQNIIECTTDEHERFYVALQQREEHYHQVLYPFLFESDKSVLISDRFYYSTAAYQGFVTNDNGAFDDDLINLAIAAGGGVQADIALYLDANPSDISDWQKVRGDLVVDEKRHRGRMIQASIKYGKMSNREEFITINLSKPGSEVGKRKDTEEVVRDAMNVIAKDLYYNAYAPVAETKAYARRA